MKKKMYVSPILHVVKFKTCNHILAGSAGNINNVVINGSDEITEVNQVGAKKNKVFWDTWEEE